MPLTYYDELNKKLYEIGVNSKVKEVDLNRLEWIDRSSDEILEFNGVLSCERSCLTDWIDRSGNGRRKSGELEGKNLKEEKELDHLPFSIHTSLDTNSDS